MASSLQKNNSHPDGGEKKKLPDEQQWANCPSRVRPSWPGQGIPTPPRSPA